MKRTLFATLLAVTAGACASVTRGPSEPSGPLDYYVYVALESADEVCKVRFDGERAQVVKRIPVGYQPTEIEGPHGLAVAPDRRHWFLTMAHGKPFGLLYKYDAETDELVGKTELGLFPATMQVSAATGLLYCVNFDLHGDMSPSSVSIVDPEAMAEVARTTTGAMPHGSRLSPDGLKHYSCSMMGGTLFEIDAVDFAVERVLDLAPATTMETGMAHTAGMQAHDMHGGPAPKPTWVQPHPSEPLAYVCLNGMAQVVEVDLERWEVVRRFETAPGPYNVDVTPDGRKLVVSYKSAQAIGLWDLATGTELARIPSGRRVTHGVDLSDDGRYAFVSSEGIGSEPGTLDVIDLEANARVCTLELGLQAGGIAFWDARPRSER